MPPQDVGSNAPWSIGKMGHGIPNRRCTPLTLDSALIVITSHHIFNKQIDLLFDFLPTPGCARNTCACCASKSESQIVVWQNGQAIVGFQGIIGAVDMRLDPGPDALETDKVAAGEDLEGFSFAVGAAVAAAAGGWRAGGVLV